MKLKQTKLIDRKIVKHVRFYQGIYDKLDTKYFINQIGYKFDYFFKYT